MSIVIRANTAEEEFDYLKFVLSSLDFYKKNNYSPVLPNETAFQEKIDPKDARVLYDKFKEEEYDPKYFQQGLEYLSTKKKLLEECLDRLKTLSSLWNYKTFESYNVCLTKYGPGGSYNYKTGKLILLVRKDGTFKRSHPEHTVIHEIVHMGIQESIVDCYKLMHWEKERLVDLFVKIFLGDYFHDYRMQDVEDKRIDKYVNSTESIHRLPDSILEFVTEVSR